MRDVAQRILDAGLRAVDPQRGVEEAVRVIDPPTGRLLVAGAGKAAIAMTRGLLGKPIDSGLIVVKHDDGLSELGPVRVRTGAHPLPDESSQAAGAALLEFVADAGPGDLVLCPISGGASSLAIAPRAGITVAQIRERTDMLLRAGADIGELNAMRAELDRLKAGGLARAASPARVVGLVLSDIPDGSLELVGSGPTFAAGAKNIGVGSNADAIAAASQAAVAEGFAVGEPMSLGGEASEAGIELGRRLTALAERGGKHCIVAGGETTVVVRGSGRGGRNQELALAAVPLLYAHPRALLVTFATDGEDGTTDAAGAVVDGTTLTRALEAGLDPTDHLVRNDSYAFFDALDDLLRPGPTGTNVCDLALAMVW